MGSSLFPQQGIQRIQVAQPMLMPQMTSTPTQTGNTAKESQEQILQLWRMVKTSNNPQEMMNNLMMQNPELKKVVDTMNALGDPKKAFYALAEKQGVDPNTILSMLT